MASSSPPSTLTKPLLVGKIVEDQDQDQTTETNQKEHIHSHNDTSNPPSSPVRVVVAAAVVVDSDHTGTNNHDNNHDNHDNNQEPNNTQKHKTKTKTKTNPLVDDFQYYSPSQRMTMAKRHPQSPTTKGAEATTTTIGGYHHHLYLKDKNNVDDTRNSNFCLCCMGFRYFTSTQSTATFLCPWCNQQQSYQRKQSQKRYHICFIPLPNMGFLLGRKKHINTTNNTTSEDDHNSYIKCKGCHKHFRLSVLTDQDTLYQDILEQPVLEVLVQIMMLKQREQTATNTIQPDNIEQIQQYYQNLIGRPLTISTILHADRDDTTTSDIDGENENDYAANHGTVHWMIQRLVESIHKYDQANWTCDEPPPTEEEYTSYRFSRLQSAIRGVSLHLTTRQKEALSKIMRDEIYNGNAVASLHW